MKRIVLSFALLVIAQSGKPSVIEYRLQEPSFAATENAPFQERGRGNGTYTKDSWTVFYRGYEVEGASPSSFEDLGSGYGKDAWKVFYQGLGIEGASPSSFRSFGDGYAKDDLASILPGQKNRKCLLVFIRKPRRRLWERQLDGFLQRKTHTQRLRIVVRKSGQGIWQRRLESFLQRESRQRGLPVFLSDSAPKIIIGTIVKKYQISNDSILLRGE